MFICIITEQCSVQEKGNVNVRKTAKSIWVIDYTKSKDCMMWIHPWQNERQGSINESWSGMLGNQWCNRFPFVINEVLDVFMGK
jgi:hypothetical protein